MHETYLAECVLRQMRDALPQGVEPMDVETVQLRVGQIDAVMPDILTEMFDVLKSNFSFPNAKLLIDVEAVWCRCKDCDAEFGLDSPVFVCPHCLGCRIQLLRGRGITLTEITVHENEYENTNHS